MALGLPVISFVGISVISIIGLALMYLLKNERAKAGVFYFLSIWGMGIAILSAAGLIVHLKNYSDTEDIFQTVFLKYVLHSEPFESE